MTKIYGYDTNIYETSIGNLIEPIQNFKYSCTDEDIKKAMEHKSYIEVILQEKDKEIERLNNIIDKAIEYIHNHQLVFELSSKKQIQDWFDMFYKDSLNILNGDDEERI